MREQQRAETKLTLAELMEVMLKRGIQVELCLKPVMEFKRVEPGETQEDLVGFTIELSVGAERYNFDPVNRNFKDSINEENGSKMRDALNHFLLLAIDSTLGKLSNELSPELRAKCEKIAQEAMRAPKPRLHGRIEERYRPYDDEEDDSCPSCGQSY